MIYMVDMRIIYKAQLEFIRAVVHDIIKHGANDEILNYVLNYEGIEVEGNTECEAVKNRYSDPSWLRINIGESFAYIAIDKETKRPRSEEHVTWSNEDMGVSRGASVYYENTFREISTMTLEESFVKCPYAEAYGTFEGREQLAVPKYEPFGTDNYAYILVASNGRQIDHTVYPSKEDARNALKRATDEYNIERNAWSTGASWINDDAAFLSPTDSDIEEEWSWEIIAIEK